MGRQVTVTVSAQDKFSGVLSGFTNKMRDANRATDGMKQATSAASSAFSLMGGAVTGAVAGLAVGQIIQFTGELVEMGSAVTLNNQRLEALAGNADNAAQLMNRLRVVTKGTVDDMTLMGGANELMRTGIAGSADEVETLLEMALALRKPTMSAQEAIDDFTAMLLNSSIPRLDSFGISSGQVKTQIDALIKSGQAANRDEAFAMAVMEIGADSMERLGEATGIADSAVMRLQTRMKNMQQDFAEWANAGIEAGASLVEKGLAPVDEWMENQAANAEARESAAAFADEYTEMVYGEIVKSFGVTEGYENAIRMAIQQALEDAAAGREFTVDEGLLNAGIRTEIYTPEVREQLQAAYLYAPMIDPTLGTMSAQQGITGDGGRGAERERMAEMSRMAREAAEAQRQADNARIAASYDMLSLYEQEAGMLDTINQHERDAIRMADMRKAAVSDINSMYESSVFAVGGLELMTDDDMLALYAATDELEAMAAEAERLGLDTSSFEQAAENARDIANSAQRANEAFHTMGMAEAFGATGDPTQNFLSDVLGAAGISGQYADLATGDTTSSQIFFDDNIQPVLVAINEQLGEEAAVDAAARFTNRYKELLAAGMSADYAVREAGAEIGYEMAEGAGEAFTVQMGDTLTGLANETGMSQEAIMAQLQEQYGVTDPRLIQAGMTFGGGGGLVSTLPPGYMGPGNIPEDAGQFGFGYTAPQHYMGPGNIPEDAGQMGPDISGLEERRTIVNDISTGMELAANHVKDMETFAGSISLDPETLGLADTLSTTELMLEKLEAATNRTFEFNIQYNLKTVGELPPGGGDMMPVPTGSGEIM